MKRLFILSLLTMALLLTAGIAWALPLPTTIDGDPADWDDAVCLVDEGGVDDESSPTTADITEFCAHVDDDYIYVSMAWDHTAFTGGNASTAGARLDVDADGLFDFNILATLGGTPAVIQGYSIGSCDAAGACGNADDVCSSTGGGGGPCTGALAAVSALWVDPFGPTGRAANVCNGADCLSNDAFVELAVPWSLLSLPGPPHPHVFGDYGSYPSGPAQAPKDDVAFGNGISCRPDGVCFVSTPTAITLGSLDVTAPTASGALLPALAALALLALATAAVLSRRATHRSPS